MQVYRPVGVGECQFREHDIVANNRCTDVHDEVRELRQRRLYVIKRGVVFGGSTAQGSGVFGKLSIEHPASLLLRPYGME